MNKGKKELTPMEKLAIKAGKVLKSKPQKGITKQDFDKAVKKAVKPKGRATK